MFYRQSQIYKNLNLYIKFREVVIFTGHNLCLAVSYKIQMPLIFYGWFKTINYVHIVHPQTNDLSQITKHRQLLIIFESMSIIQTLPR